MAYVVTEKLLGRLMPALYIPLNLFKRPCICMWDGLCIFSKKLNWQRVKLHLSKKCMKQTIMNFIHGFFKLHLCLLTQNAKMKLMKRAHLSVLQVEMVSVSCSLGAQLPNSGAQLPNVWRTSRTFGRNCLNLGPWSQLCRRCGFRLCPGTTFRWCGRILRSR